MNAIVLAGGKGTRLMPLTSSIPKPMLTIAFVPMLDYVTSQLKFFGIKNIVYAVAYKKEQIISRANSYKGINATFSIDDIPLGTAGSVKKALAKLSDTFIVVSGDCLNDIDLSALIKAHEKSNNDVTIAVVEREDTTKYGVVKLDKNNQVLSLIEKPKTNSYGNKINAGVYVINKRIFSAFCDGPLDFSKDVFPILVQKGKVGAYLHKGYWTDIGAIYDYYTANFYMKDKSFFPLIKSDDEKYEKYNGSIISKSASVLGSAKNSIICSNAIIQSGVSVLNSVILPKSTVKSSCKNCIIGQDFALSIPSE